MRIDLLGVSVLMQRPMSVVSNMPRIHVQLDETGNVQWRPPLVESSGFRCKEMRPGMHVLYALRSQETLQEVQCTASEPIFFVKATGWLPTETGSGRMESLTARAVALTEKDVEQGVALFINSRESLHEFAREYIPKCDPTFLQSLDEVSLQHPLSSFANVLLQDMFSPSLPPMLEKLALEKGWLKILTHELDFLAEKSVKQGNAQGIFLSEAETALLKKAREILVGDLASPPDMTALSRRVGMNHYKFKKGFKQLFGHPPMTYLRNQRMEEARRLLRDSRKTVTQAALEVGYSNPSAFSAKFTEYFGHNPKRYK